jgi:hypothetical protein
MSFTRGARERDFRDLCIPYVARQKETAIEVLYSRGYGRSTRSVGTSSGCHAGDDSWDLERYLTQRRKEIVRRYDSRTSRLTQVFGRLLSESHI